MPQVVGVFGSKGDALAAVDQLYEFGYGDTEIGFIDQGEDIPLLESGLGSTVLSVSIIDGDEGEVSRLLLATGALQVKLPGEADRYDAGD